MWTAIATVVISVIKFLLGGWLVAYLHKRAGAKEARLEGEIEVAKKERAQHQALANSSSTITDADDFADRVRDSGF